MAENTHIITEDDIRSCWKWHITYFADILNGEKDLQEAREDLLGLIGSEFDPRTTILDQEKG